MGFNSWFPNQQVLFVDRLQELQAEGKVTVEILAVIDSDLGISNTIQPEVMQRWFPLGIMNDYAPVFDNAHKFISEQGRMKYLNPIYSALVKSGFRNKAFMWYQENESFYHPIARATLKGLLLLGLNHEEELALQKHEL